MTDFETHPAGTAARIAELTAAQKYRYIGKDGKPVLARDLEDRIEQLVATVEQLEAALTRANAAAAAAYEVAAQMVETTAYTSNGDTRSLEPVAAGLSGMDMHHATIATAIRALATPDQTAALDAVRAEARAQGMREAAEICQTLGPLGGVTPNPRAEWKTHADNLAHAILAAIKGAKA